MLTYVKLLYAFCIHLVLFFFLVATIERGIVEETYSFASCENDYILVVRLVQRVEGLVRLKENACPRPPEGPVDIKANAVVRLLLLFKYNTIVSCFLNKLFMYLIK